MSDKNGFSSYLERASEAISKGEDPRDAILGDGTSAQPADWRTSEDRTSKPTDKDAVEEYLDSQDGSENTENESEEVTEELSPNESKSDAQSQLEEVLVKDARGRKKKLQIDYQDKEAIKKQALLAHGARKWQNERDTAKKQLNDISPKYQELQSQFGKLEEAYASGGVQALVDLLDGEGAHDKYQKSLIDRYENRKTASVEELAQMDAQEHSNKQSSAFEKLQQEMQELREQTAQSKDEAAFDAMTALVTPSFDKFRFDGKLGDSVQEHRLDTMLWNEVSENLATMEDSGTTVTREMARREFRKVSSDLRKMITVQGERKAKKTIAKKKQEATTHAQKRVINGVTSNRSADALKAAVKSGNIEGLLANFWNRK